MSTEAFDPDRATAAMHATRWAMWMSRREVPGRQLQIDEEERASVQRYLARARRMRSSLIRRWWLGCL